MQSINSTKANNKKPYCEKLAYAATKRFSKIVLDYLDEEPALRSFYRFAPNFDGISKAVEQRRQYPIDRKLLVDYFNRRYKNSAATKKQSDNINLLLLENTFTVTTAHQPNIFSGPLYFLYKILHTIQLASRLTAEMPEQNFVPVFYMGSEDADLEELGHFFIDNHKLNWPTDQVGAVGRMHNKGLEIIVKKLQNWLYNQPHADEVIGIFNDAYTNNPNVQEATFQFVNALFGRFGLLVIVPDDAELKRAFEPWVKRELLEQFSGKIVQETNDKLQAAGYEPQASGREINLFYLNDEGRRERMEKEGESFTVPALHLSFSETALITELEKHPERFSGNVILRGLFQEHILPNIAFIGGGGEIAYWLQLENLFSQAGISFPALLLRNSFALIKPSEKELQQKLGLTNEALFQKDIAIRDEIAERFTEKEIPDTGDVQKQINAVYAGLLKQATDFDSSLYGHVAALHTQTLKGLSNLNKRYKSRARKRVKEQTAQWEKLQQKLFPQNGLQERVENFIPFYAEYGAQFVDWILEASDPLTEKFTVIHLPDTAN